MNMNLPIDIKVTMRPEHLANATPSLSCSCPVANAILDALRAANPGEGFTVHAYTDVITIANADGLIREYATPTHVTAFMERFDANRMVKPLDFSLSMLQFPSGDLALIRGEAASEQTFIDTPGGRACVWDVCRHHQRQWFWCYEGCGDAPQGPFAYRHKAIRDAALSD